MTTAPRARKPESPQTALKAEQPTPTSRVERDANPLTAALGKELKRLRIERQLSQEELADKSEVDRTLISRIERGVANPSLMTLSVICFVLDITLSEMLAPIRTNLKPQWADPSAPVRRATGAGQETSARRLR